MSSRNLSGYRESEPRALTLCEGSNELLGCRRIEDGAVIPYFDPSRVSILADSNDHGKPDDLRHVMKFDSDDGLASQRKAFRQMPFEQRAVGQKARRKRKPARTPSPIADNAARHLTRARCRPEMGRHPINASGFEPVAHRTSQMAASSGAAERDAAPHRRPHRPLPPGHDPTAGCARSSSSADQRRQSQPPFPAVPPLRDCARSRRQRLRSDRSIGMLSSCL
ncbi:hypothetical protein ABIE89_005069 [Bradyrhizobium niftali]